MYIHVHLYNVRMHATCIFRPFTAEIVQETIRGRSSVIRVAEPPGAYALDTGHQQVERPEDDDARQRLQSPPTRQAELARARACTMLYGLSPPPLSYL